MDSTKFGYIANRFSIGFMSGEFPGHSSTVNQLSSKNVCIFRLPGYRSQVVRRSKGEPLRPGRIQQAPKYPHKKMFWGSFDDKGTGRLNNAEGMMNGDKYKTVLRTHLLLTMQMDFPDGDGIFQEDPIPCHTSRKIRTFMRTSLVQEFYMSKRLMLVYFPRHW